MATRAATKIRIGRLERPALTGVLVREIVNFSSYWRSATFSSTSSRARPGDAPRALPLACEASRR